MLGFFHVNRNIRSIRRSRQIIRVLLTYGFDHLLDMMGLSTVVARGRRILRRSESLIARMHPAVRVRLAMEELGPTFIKLGQLLSTRPDLIPRTYLVELSKLQDDVPPVPFAQIETQLAGELGERYDSLFRSIAPEPIAAASIAQVHGAILHDGTPVVVKVRRPGIVETVDTDIDLMLAFAHLAERHIPELSIYDPVGVVREFARTIRREMELAREGRTIEKFRDNFQGDPMLVFPKVYWEGTSPGVLTMERIDGIKVSDIHSLDTAGCDRKLIALTGARAFLRMVVDHGFFHGDPHPGNVMILPGNRICLLDYGMVGRLDDHLREYLADILLAIVNRDVDGIIAILLSSGEISEPVETRRLRRELSEFIDSYYEVSLKELEVGKLLLDFIEIITTFRIRLQPDFILLAKALVTVEGMGRQLDPDFDMISVLKPFMLGVVKQRLDPKHFMATLEETGRSYLSLLKALPRDIREFVGKLNRNSFKIDLEHRGLERFIRELDKSMNRLSFSLIISALIIGSSIVMQIDKGPKFMGFPIFAFAGYLTAVVIGFWWIIAILRSGKL
ncbi:MAG: AarF/UbiB family protein [Desulfuromonadia bacterium]